MNPRPTSSPVEQQDGHCRCGLRVRRSAHNATRLGDGNCGIPIHAVSLWAFWGIWLTVLLWCAVSWLRQHLSPKAVRAGSIGSVDDNDDHRGRSVVALPPVRLTATRANLGDFVPLH